MQQCQTHLCLSVYIITFVTGFPSNILTFYTFSVKMQEVANNMTWNMPYALCPLSGFIFYMTIYNSTFFLTAVSVERYLGVAYPIRHSLTRRPIYAAMASVFIWLLSVTHLSIVYIMPYYNPSAPSNSSNLSGVPSTFHNVCYENFSDEQLAILLPVRLELCIVLFCIPLLICSFCYINFIRILLRLPNISRRRRLRAIGLALGTLVVFALCFGPYNVSHVVGFITHKSPHWRDLALLLSSFNACLDPFIFYLSSSAVRSMLARVLRGFWTRLCLWDTWSLRCCFMQRMGHDQAKKGALPEPGPSAL
ncbi:free fatty acid receptor 2-like isoform X2 [Denticeps clupeoides]|uniref:free fatty acid receptor 2-like isoform X2 n=1 Tax=Denticeps clupeoides TaxID=299321 RepID=UPI0010A53552|nr:free fatty acid receptor 2-like isoform X2 [Denticeps clupeoides]